MKVLILSHNPITDYQNMGKTMLSLFSSFEKKELCQFYVYPTLPNIDKCNSYYRITDKDILKSLPLKLAKGNIIQKEQINIKQGMFEKQSDQKLYKSKHNHNIFIMFARDFAWKFGRYWTKDLQEWIMQEKPEVVFIAPGRGGFLYDIAIKISHKYHIPIITYICDDYYFWKSRRLDIIIYNTYLKNKITRLMNRTSKLIGICENITKVYSEQFDLPAITIMTGASISTAAEIREYESPSTLYYFGNIRCNRYLSLADVGRALDSINRDRATKYSLKIFSAETDSSILNLFRDIESIQFCGYITGEEYKKQFNSSEILLHVEAFDLESIDRVRNSVSTKIADSLASGIHLFAYGPSEVESIRYLKKYDCATVCSEITKLKEQLIDLFTERVKRDEKTSNALKLSRQNHSTKKNSDLLYFQIERVIKNQEKLKLLK